MTQSSRAPSRSTSTSRGRSRPPSTEESARSKKRKIPCRSEVVTSSTIVSRTRAVPSSRTVISTSYRLIEVGSLPPPSSSSP